MGKYIKLAAATLLLLTAGCSRSSMTGHYLARFSNGIYRLQLVETPNHQLTGQLDTVVINASDKLQFASYAALGVADGNSVSLTFKQVGILGADMAGSGETDGTKLSLTGTLNPRFLSTVSFTRSSDNQYQSAVNDLINSVNVTNSSKARMEAEKALRARQLAFANAGSVLASDLERFNGEVDQHLARWPHTKSIYQQITAKMDDYLVSARQATGSTAADVRRDQIIVAMDQASVATDQLHAQVLGLESEFKANIVPLPALVQKATGDCESHNAITTTAQGASACQAIARTRGPFQAKYVAFSNGLSELEQVYQNEHAKQEQLIQAAQQIH